jgi:hypothetical protein
MDFNFSNPSKPPTPENSAHPSPQNRSFQHKLVTTSNRVMASNSGEVWVDDEPEVPIPDLKMTIPPLPTSNFSFTVFPERPIELPRKIWSSALPDFRVLLLLPVANPVIEIHTSFMPIPSLFYIPAMSHEPSFSKAIFS